MRDPKRISRILEKLGYLWHLNPGLRLGQLVVNLTPHGEEYLFTTEDDMFEAALDEAIKLEQGKDRLH